MGFYINSDALPLQIGTDKARVELGGDYLAYGPNRVYESLINLGATSFGIGSIQNPALPNGFSGTTTPIAAGILGLTTLFPLQQTAPVTTGDTNGLTTISKPQLYIDQVDLEVLIGANAGTGGATGITGIGLVTIDPVAKTFVQVTPNAGVQLMGAATNAKMGTGMHYTWYADGSSFGSSTNGAFTAAPVAGSWLGNVPLVTNSITPLPVNAFVSVTATGGTYSGSGATGLLKVRVYYNWYGTINQ